MRPRAVVIAAVAMILAIGVSPGEAQAGRAIVIDGGGDVVTLPPDPPGSITTPERLQLPIGEVSVIAVAPFEFSRGVARWKTSLDTGHQVVGITLALGSDGAVSIWLRGSSETPHVEQLTGRWRGRRFGDDYKIAIRLERGSADRLLRTIGVATDSPQQTSLGSRLKIRLKTRARDDLTKARLRMKYRERLSSDQREVVPRVLFMDARGKLEEPSEHLHVVATMRGVEYPTAPGFSIDNKDVGPLVDAATDAVEGEADVNQTLDLGGGIVQELGP